VDTTLTCLREHKRRRSRDLLAEEEVAVGTGRRSVATTIRTITSRMTEERTMVGRDTLEQEEAEAVEEEEVKEAETEDTSRCSKKSTSTLR
jgi:hypothetical protein